mmetsp:Transcript_7004/g.11628  ORF Transcript_7004/g.11628 Transcript_7004/m.11628 type:complete len:122 (+) Transcript_7004:686-1051(+)
MGGGGLVHSQWRSCWLDVMICWSMSNNGSNLECKSLGHIHEGYGTSFDGTTLFVNASNLDLDYEHVHPCVVIDLPHDSSLCARVVKSQCNLTGKDFLRTIWRNGQLQGARGCTAEVWLQRR